MVVRFLDVPPIALAAVGLVATLVLGGCEVESAPRCEFGESRELATANENGFRALATVLIDEKPWAFYSTQHALYMTALGSPADEDEDRPIWLGPPCDSLAVIADEDSAILACGRLPRPAKDDVGGIAMLRAADGRLTQQRFLPLTIGRDHQGLALAQVSGESSLSLAYHVGRPGDWSTWLVELDADWALGTPRLMSSRSVSGGAPDLIATAEGLDMVWPEGWIDISADEPGDWEGHLMWAHDPASGRRPQEVVNIHFEHPSPKLAVDSQGLVLFFRDVRRPDRRAGLFARRIAGAGVQGEELRIARANGPSPPQILSCGGKLVTVASRSFSSDFLIGVNVLDDELGTVVPEQQVYEWSSRFTNAAAVCNEGRIELVVAERHRLAGVAAPLHSLSLECR